MNNQPTARASERSDLERTLAAFQNGDRPEVAAAVGQLEALWRGYEEAVARIREFNATGDGSDAIAMPDGFALVVTWRPERVTGEVIERRWIFPHSRVLAAKDADVASVDGQKGTIRLDGHHHDTHVVRGSARITVFEPRLLHQSVHLLTGDDTIFEAQPRSGETVTREESLP